MNWAGHYPSDGSTNEVQMLIGDAECFALKLQRATYITVRAQFYQEGIRDMEFNVSGLSGLSLPAPSQTKLRKCRVPIAIG
jgi:hypothetical protein